MKQLINFFHQLFTTGTNLFPPRWYCGTWSDFHGWLYIISDLAIWGAYFAIPLLLWYFVRKRRDVPFLPTFNFFIAFILSCGTTHLVDALIFWYPIYHFSAVVRFITAVVSWATVIVLFKVIPKALSLKSPAQLEEIIHQKTAELALVNERLAQKELLFRTLVNHNPDIITLMDTEMRHIFVSDAIKIHTGLNPDYFIGKTHEELNYPTAYIQETKAKIQQAIHQRSSLRYETKSWDLPEDDPNFKIYELDVVPLIVMDKPIQEILIVSTDISHQKKIEKNLENKVKELEVMSQELARQNKQLQEFAYITSHNLRSPTGNLNSLYRLYQDSTDETERKFLVEKIGEVSSILHQTVEDLAEVVKIRQNVSIKLEGLSFEAQVNDIKTTLAGQIISAEAEILTDFTSCPTIQYHKVYLESILLNLITNGIKYRSPERKPQIHLTTYISKKGEIVLTCKDNGVGIDLKKYGHKIFGLYKTFHHNPDARGVGLFITKNQIEAMGGEIQVSSEINQGTVFTIIFNKTSNL